MPYLHNGDHYKIPEQGMGTDVRRLREVTCGLREVTRGLWEVTWGLWEVTWGLREAFSGLR